FTHHLSEALKEFQQSERVFSVLMLDIDRFKRINDSFGHSYGDEAIKYAVKVLNDGLEDSGCFGRIGGEEFAVILYDTSVNNAALVAEKLRKKLEESQLIVSGESIELTISIGVTQVFSSDDDIKNILARADNAMYHSKNTGRNKVSIYSSNVE
ncbi:GGDEF domain-containing protein, partial [Vibrio genomosp. F10]|uniref:GGDEF domain-containing protein n=1 Tax=Vibrio genomosp. F10 TaxID=723171 RepID=UPI000AF693B8